MALTRKAKIWIIILSIPLLLMIAGVVVLKAMFTGERLKAFLVPRIEEATGRTVTVADVSLNIFPSIAVEVESLLVSNTQEEGFSQRPFLTLDRLVLDVSLIPLIKGSFEIPTILIEHPVLLLEVNENGVANYAGEETQPASGGDTVKVSMNLGEGQFLLSNLQITGGVMEYYDRQGNTAMKAEGINQILRIETEPVMREARLWSESTVDHLSYGTLTSDLISGLRMTAKAELLFRERDDRLSIVKGEGTVQDIVLTMSGNFDSISTTPQMNLVFESNNASIPQLLSLAPKEYMKKAEGLEGTGTAQISIVIAGTVTDSTQPDVTGSISATNATVRYGSLPKPITNVNIVSDFTRTAKKQEFRVTKFSAHLGENPMSATMTVVNFDNPSITLALNAVMNLAEVKDYYPLEQGTELSGSLKANVNIAGKVDQPAQMKASGSMDFQNVTMKTATSPNPVRNLNGSITFNNQVVESKKLSMMLGKSDVALGFLVRNYLSLMTEVKDAPKASASMTVTSDHLYTADIMTEDAPAPEAGSPGGKKKEDPFVLPDIAMDITASIGTLTMEKFELTNVRSTMRIADGVITLQNFSGAIYNGTINTSGTLDLRNTATPLFDLALDIKSLDAHALLPNFTSFGSRLFGDLSMSTKLQGALDDTMGLVTQALTGGGNVSVASGKLTGVKVNQAIASMVGLPNLEEINFKDWANSFTIANGRMEVKDLKISALDADYFLNGSVGLDGSLDYAMSVLLPPSASAKLAVPGFAGQATELFKDQSGRIKLDFKVGGMMGNPTVSLNTDAAKKKAEDLAMQKLAEEKKKLEDELKKKAGDLLKELDPFKKKK
jgi:uncharacterized protein involved in outer membrane biogenesis